MKLGIVSDTHNELNMFRTVIGMLKSLGVMTLIHCGDVTHPSLFEELKGFHIFCVYGNNDLDRFSLKTKLEQIGTENQIDSFLKLNLDGKKIYVIHGDVKHRLNNAIASGMYDYVFHGHSHRAEDENYGKTRVLNPGGLGGRYSGKRSFMILNLQTDKIEKYFLD